MDYGSAAYHCLFACDLTCFSFSGLSEKFHCDPTILLCFPTIFPVPYLKPLNLMFADYLTGDKQYKFEEILPIYKTISGDEDTGTFADFMEGFKTFDREGQGYISAAELRNVMTMMGMCVPGVIAADGSNTLSLLDWY